MTDKTTTQSRHIVIFDTTLRDGEQSPGASMNLAEKMEVAQALVELGVDVIEAGFPIASPGDFEAVREIARSVRGAVICGLARCRDADIDRAWEAVRHAERPRIHVFLATSAIHREHKLQMDKDEIIQRAVAGVKRAAGYCADVEFSPEDAARTETDFLCQVVEAAIDAGATTVNIPDTVGYATPTPHGRRHPHAAQPRAEHRQGRHQRPLPQRPGPGRGQQPGGRRGRGRARSSARSTAWASGRATARSKRSSWPCAPAHDFYHAATGIDTRRLVPTSRLVANITGIQVQRNKAIVGQNAFAHEAGIHQDGMLKERTTYEIMRPEDVGFAMSDLVLGKHSGRAALADRAKAMGYSLTGEQLDTVFEQFKVLADKKKEIYDADIAALIEQQIHAVAEKWTLDSYKVICGTGQVPEVTLRLRRGDEKSRRDTSPAATARSTPSSWPSSKLTGISVVCRDFSVHSVTVGKDAQGEVMVQVEHDGQLYRGRGVSTDSVEASAKAFLNAINRVLAVANNKRIGNRIWGDKDGL